jgi:AraC-like DNA-binding protein
VERILRELDIEYSQIHLGEVITKSPADKIENLRLLKIALQESGFELLESKKNQLIEKIKYLADTWVMDKKERKVHQTFSEFLSDSLGREYSYLSALFSENEGVTIKKYIILQKIEKAKEMIRCREMNLAQIAECLGYNSPAHFSYQFKKNTNQSPVQYKESITHHKNT